MADGGMATTALRAEQSVETSGPARPAGLARWRKPLLIVVPALVVLAGLGAYLAGGRMVSIDNAYVKSDMTTIGTDVAGIVAQVAVRDNQPVKAGDLLYRLDDASFRNTLANAEAQLASARNDIETMRATYRQRQQDILQAANDVAFYGREYQRQSDLVRSNVASKVALDQAQHNLAKARQTLESLKQDAAGVLAGLSGNADIAVEDHPRYLAAKAEVDQATRDLNHARVTAPVDGIVTRVDTIQPGEYLPAGTAAFSLVASGHSWVEANPKETDLTYVRPGQPVTVTVDSYPGQLWHGTVEAISPATGAEFAILPPQNASGNWVKVVQRIPLRVALDQEASAPPLRAGMSATVTVDTGRRRSLFDWVGSATAETASPQATR